MRVHIVHVCYVLHICVYTILALFYFRVFLASSVIVLSEVPAVRIMGVYAFLSKHKDCLEIVFQCGLKRGEHHLLKLNRIEENTHSLIQWISISLYQYRGSWLCPDNKVGQRSLCVDLASSWQFNLMKLSPEQNNA